MQILPGKYRHFKGGLYEVIGVARHSETLEEMVVYRALYGEGGLWVRPATMWNETVTRDGVTYRRFTPVTEGAAAPGTDPERHGRETAEDDASGNGTVGHPFGGGERS